MQTSVLELIKKLEEEIGPLSKVQRALLSTDGSVTRLLEVFCNAPVGVETKSQKIIAASDTIAQSLGISIGEEVNYREVDLYNKTTHDVLIHAVSYAPLSHLPSNATIRLMKEDEPIGNIMRDEMMESRREVLSVGYNNFFTHGLQNSDLNRQTSCISRLYRIIHNNKPIFLIEENIPKNLFSEKKTVWVKTPSRLHIGLLDMNGSFGRIDGGAGITLNDPGFDFEISESDSFILTSENQDITGYVYQVLERLQNNGFVIPPVHIHINQHIPFHCGLGSGTQLALGLVSGISTILAKESNCDELLSVTGRGGTSGIGSKAFFQGGLLVDAGHRFGPGKRKTTFSPSSVSSQAGIAPLVGRYMIPEEWNFIVAIPDGLREIYGKLEEDIFQKYCPVPVQDVRVLSHLVLMKLIPSVIEKDLDEFGAAINEFQEYGFKKCELGLQHPIIGSLIESMRNAGASGVGMSSFGPVVYGVCDTGSSDVISAAKETMNNYCGGNTILTKGRNRGAEIIC